MEDLELIRPSESIWNSQNWHIMQGLDMEQELPSTLVKEKELSDEDMKLLRRQWNLFLRMNSVSVQNDIRIRQKLWLPILTKWTRVHWTRFDLDKLRSIKKYWIISWELIWIVEDNETNYCADFFVVPQDYSVQWYTWWYQEMETSPWTTFRSKRMESSRLATNNNSSVTIIFNSQSSELDNFLKYDAYHGWRERMQTIITWLLFKDKPEKQERLSAILVWIPSNFISAIIIPPKISNDPENVSEIKEIFWDWVIIFDIEWNEI